MIKINVNSNEQSALDFVKEVQGNPLLKDVLVDLNNVNDCVLYLEERENCVKCNGLSHCLNTTEGYVSVIENGYIVAKQCTYKKQALIKAKEGSLIKTLFIPQKILNADLANFDTNTDSRRKIYA